MAFSDLFTRRRRDESDADTASADAPVHSTKALPKFLTSLASRPQPMLLDLGPVVGSNVTFFGEQLGCKIYVENLYKDVDRHVREGKVDDLQDFLEKRFVQEDASVDGILCWDVLDYLEFRTARIVARQLTRLLRPGGALFAQFLATAPQKPQAPTYTKYVVVDQSNLQYRTYSAARGRQKPLLNRDIQRMFEPLAITEQFLLKTNLREMLFRKPAASPPVPASAA